MEPPAAPRAASQKHHAAQQGASPSFAGVDPYNFYIDRNSDDNVKDVTAG